MFDLQYEIRCKQLVEQKKKRSIWQNSEKRGARAVPSSAHRIQVFRPDEAILRLEYRWLNNVVWVYPYKIKAFVFKLEMVLYFLSFEVVPLG